jgi:Tol biopolymer transport system component
MWDWSPDGSRLVVQHRDGRMPVLSIVPSDGSGAVRRLDVGPLEPDNPAWRPPDGQEIVFRGKSDGGSSSALYAIKPDGSGLRPITRIVPSGDAYSASRLSPDGAAVTYTNFNEPDGSLDGVGGHVHVLDLRTGVDHLVADDPSVANETEPQFSPDGTLVLYRRYGLDVQMRLMLAPRRGDTPARLVGPAQDPDGNYVIAFSPDGKQLFVSHQNGTPWQVITLADGSIQYGAAVDDWAHWQRLALPAD